MKKEDALELYAYLGKSLLTVIPGEQERFACLKGTIARMGKKQEECTSL